jgi:hypothetical protein
VTIAFDAYTAIGSGGNDISATHTPVGTPKGVFVTITLVIAASSVINDETQVTYGGVEMQEIAQYSVGGAEQCNAAIYFLGEGIPTGAQTVVVKDNGMSPWTKFVDCITVTAASDLVFIEDAANSSGGTAVDSLTLTNTISSGNFYSVAAYSTGFGVPATLVTADFTTARSTDHGPNASGVFYDDAERTTGNGTINWTQSSQPIAGALCTVQEGTPDGRPIVVGKVWGGKTNGNVPLTLNLTKIATLAKDDVVIAWFAADENTTAVSTVSSGWTEVAYVQPDVNTNLHVYRKVMGVTVDASIVSSTHAATDGISGGCVAFRGIDTATPLDVAITTASAVAAASADNPSITPTTNGCILLFIGAQDVASTSPSYITAGTYHNHHYGAGNDTNPIETFSATFWQETAAAIDPPAWTNAAATTSWAAVSIALRPGSAVVLPEGAVTQTWTTVKSQVVSTGVEVINVMVQTWTTAKSQVVNTIANKFTGGVIQTWTSSKSQIVNANSPLSGGSGRMRTFSGSGI